MTATGVASERGRVGRGVIVAAMTGNFSIALAAFLMSYEALRDLAALAGVPEKQAWLWPLIVDGVILEATISVVALRDADSRARRFAWLLLVAGAGVSVGANITHALLTADDRVPALVAALVASVPPLVLVAMTHLTVELIRNAAPRPDRDVGVDQSAEAVPALGGTTPPAITPRSDSRPVDRRPRGGTSGREQRERRRREAARMAAEGVPVREIARRFGVHPTTVTRWLDTPDRPVPAPDRSSPVPDLQATASDASAKEDNDGQHT